MVWWYGGIIKNIHNDQQPSVWVVFRELPESKQVRHLSECPILVRRVPITALGQFSIGSVWRDGRCRFEAALDAEKFSVDFSEAGWYMTSFYHATLNRAGGPYPFEKHPLNAKDDFSWMIVFKLKNGKKLIIPSMEYFSRCYGGSAELRRVLVTYNWKEVENRCFAPLEEQEERNVWKLKLRRRLVNRDAIFLAHVKYDEYTRMKAKRIYSQIETFYSQIKSNDNKPKPVFIKVEPWHRGQGEIKVKGFWVEENKTFLGVHIIGCSDPHGVTILRDRDNTNKTDEPADGEGGTAWKGMPERVQIECPDIIVISDEDPDQGAVAVEVADPDFEILGTPRVVRDVRHNQAKDSAGPKIPGKDADKFSGGEEYGQGKTTGYMADSARPKMESEGMLRDTWHAMLHLAEKYHDTITCVEWFTFADGYSTAREPKLIGVHPFEKTDEVSLTIRKWPYMMGEPEPVQRGILVARMTINGKFIHFIEIQRRPQTRKVGDSIEEVEESYKGLVFILNKQEELDAWIKTFISRIRYECGIVQKLVKECPGKAAVFKHVPSRDEEVVCEAAVKNALRKMGIELKGNLAQ
jgi:hypothetical protein